MYFAARLPIINYFYFAFFDDATGPPPSRDDVSALANTIALVTALLFTIVAAVPMSVSTDDLNEWDWKYGVTVSFFSYHIYLYHILHIRHQLTAFPCLRCICKLPNANRTPPTSTISLFRSLTLVPLSLGCNRVRTDALGLTCTCMAGTQPKELIGILTSVKL